MSGFATSWLDLREPADHAARDGELLKAACAWLDAADRPTIVDVGCGTGSTVRALSRHLARPAAWRLVDNDPALLAAARERLSMPGLSTHEADLRSIGELPLEGAGLVTASALFDLVSRDWLGQFVARLAAGRVGLYAALNYDGNVRFADPHPDDAAVVAAFNAHQRTDKGFGPALGPASPDALVQVLERAGYRTRRAASPWRLPAGPLQRELVEGMAGAVRETGRMEGAELAAWFAFRLGSQGAAEVGHDDVLALAG